MADTSDTITTEEEIVADSEFISPESQESDLGFSTVQERNVFVTFFVQVGIMVRKNTTLQFRWWRSTLSQVILVPFILQLVLFALQQAGYRNQRKSVPYPAVKDLGPIVDCQGINPGEPCINILFTPNEEPYISMMKIFASNNAKRSGKDAWKIEEELTDLKKLPERVLGIVPVKSPEFIYDYISTNTNTTKWAITFNNTSTPVLNIQYQIWFNSTSVQNSTFDIYGNQVVSFVRGMDEAIISNLNDPSASTSATLNVTYKDWPTIPAISLSDGVVTSFGPTFFFSSVMFIFINILSQIVTEKELKLRQGMETMGLLPSAYWVSHFLSQTLLVFVTSLSTIVLGFIFQFKVFLETNFGVSLITFFLFGEAMITLGFFITTLVRRANVAVLTGIFLFIIGLLFESFLFSRAQIAYLWWDRDTADYFWKIFIMLPFFNFGLIFFDMSTLTSGKLDTLTSTYIKGPGFQWSALYEKMPEDYLPSYNGRIPPVPAPIDSWYWLLVNIATYWVLTWIFDNIIPDEYGNFHPIYFMFSPAYWGINVSGKNKHKSELEWLEKVKTKKALPIEDDEQEDVKAERERTYAPDTVAAIKLVNLHKRYGKKKVAVRNLAISFAESEVLALLGQNGAGKSTTINMLSGLTPPSGGDALIYEKSIKYRMTEIRKMMGVCPQHDILYEDLTAREHIQLYAGLKGVPQHEVNGLIESRLTAVRLIKVADQRAGTYSGGMKRRLSLVISTIGDPKVVFMDEPTTGMDPVNRRHVWTFIEKFKKGRVIVLTTHAMEEADVLGDRIAIMAHGRLRALGNSISLKNKFGAGYRISIITNPARVSETKNILESRVPDAVLEDDSAGALIYKVPLTATHEIPGFVKYLESDPDQLIQAWGISQTTLEEVFLKLIREANPEGYNPVEKKRN